MQNDNSKFKIIFMGTPEFGAIILEELSKSDFKPILVISEPDKPKGRIRIPIFLSLPLSLLFSR